MNTRSLLYLWKERTLFIGKIELPISLSQGAATLCLSLQGFISVKVPAHNEVFECTSVLIPPGHAVEIDTRNQIVANLNLDVMGADFFYLSKRSERKVCDLFFQLLEEARYRSILANIFHHAAPSECARQQLFGCLDVRDLTGFQVEVRVARIVELIQSSIDHNLPIEYLASEVNLSVPALFKIFKKQTGVPIRRYRQWYRLYITATEIGKGKSLTEAALTAGFVDLSHCAHTFNLMLGMKPSYFLQRPKDIALFVEESD